MAIAQRVWLKIASSAPSLCAWLIVWCDLVVLWNVCFLSVWSSPYLAIRLWATSSKIYWDFFEVLLVARNSIPVHTCSKRDWKYSFLRFFQKMFHLDLLDIILIERPCNFYFLIGNPVHIYLGKFLILIYCPKIFSTNQIAKFFKFQYSRSNEAIKVIFFLVTRRS